MRQGVCHLCREEEKVNSTQEVKQERGGFRTQLGVRHTNAEASSATKSSVGRAVHLAFQFLKSDSFPELL